MDSSAATSVLRNRLSWRKFDKMRKDQYLESNSNGYTRPSRNHGSHTQMTDETKAAVLTEARQWTVDESVNWSQLAKKLGLTMKNGGQSIKEFLRDQGITAATKKNSLSTTPRRKRKRLPEGIPFPMPRPSDAQKQGVVEQLESQDSILGAQVVPTAVVSFVLDRKTKYLQPLCMQGRFHSSTSEKGCCKNIRN